MVVAYGLSDMMKNWPAKMLWKAEQTHDQEQHRQQLLVLSKMERQSKQHGNESQSVVSGSLKAKIYGGDTRAN